MQVCFFLLSGMVRSYLLKHKIALSEDSGEEIERRKNVVYTHTGIVLGTHLESGKKMVFHNHTVSGPAIVTIDDFSDGFKWQYTKRIRHHSEKVLLRVFEQLEDAKPYHTILYNCQHATSYARLGRYNSQGVFNTAGLLSAVMFLGTLTQVGKSKNQ